MTTVRTDLGDTRESARRLRYEPGGTIAATNVQEAIEEVEGSFVALTGGLRVVTAVGTVTVSPTEGGVAINKAVGAATTVQLPLAASRGNLPVTVKDMKGDANANNITVLPDAGDALGIDANAQDILNVNKASRRYQPIAGGWLRV